MSVAAEQLKSFEVPFDSMEPAIASGSEVVGHVGYYASHRPERWDVVVFTLPGGDGHFIKRIVGLPGETIHLTSGGVSIDGSVVPGPGDLKGCFAGFKEHADYRHAYKELKIPADSVFVMGDNPHVVVADSRTHGPVPIRNLEARVFAAVRLALM